MNDIHEKNILIRYALQNENNLVLSLKIGLAFNDLKKMIVLDFLKELEKVLSDSLDEKEWKITNEIKENVLKSKWKCFSIEKKKWRNNFSIRLEPDQNDLMNFYVGIKKNKIEFPNSIDNGLILKELIEKYRSGGENVNWVWWMGLNDYKSWNSESVLIKLYKKEQAILDIKNILLGIKDIAEPIIDKVIVP